MQCLTLFLTKVQSFKKLLNGPIFWRLHPCQLACIAFKAIPKLFKLGKNEFGKRGFAIMDFLKFATLLIFLVAYILMVGYYNKKARIIWAAVMALLLLTVISPMEALFAINGNVLSIYIGMLFISEVFIFSKVPDFLAVKLVNKANRKFKRRSLFSLVFLFFFILFV